MARVHARQSGDGVHGSARTAPRWEDEVKPKSRLSRVTYVLGSILSVGLVIGLGVWGYKLLVRDVSGVPVIRAALGPMRVQPEDPGGHQALNQGLAVNAVAAVGSAGAAPDELILAPAPLDLSDEDVPTPNETASEPVQLAQGNEIDSDNLAGVSGAVDEIVTIQPESARPDIAEADNAPSAEMLALAEALGSDLEPLGQLPDVASDPGAEIATSLRPRARPATLRDAIQAAAVTSPATAAPSGGKEIAPESIAIGTRLAQLGAFSSEEIAREEWARLSARFEEYLGDKDRVIERASSGGRIFYRLRAMGFDDLADARRFCSALVAEKVECIPVVTR